MSLNFPSPGTTVDEVLRFTNEVFYGALKSRNECTS
jgi:hypothetical protein